MPPRKPPFGRSVFINCPFDKDYWPLFEAMVFAVVGCGFVPRCALEALDSGQPRLEKILQLIRESRFGIHDLSRVEISPPAGVPRFNMPFELGLDLAARRFAPPRTPLARKRLLVLDSVPYRYQASLSDIAGQDIKLHQDQPDRVVGLVRDWLCTESQMHDQPGAAALRRRYKAFASALPELADAVGADRAELPFRDYVRLATAWLAEQT